MYAAPRKYETVGEKPRTTAHQMREVPAAQEIHRAALVIFCMSAFIIHCDDVYLLKIINNLLQRTGNRKDS